MLITYYIFEMLFGENEVINASTNYIVIILVGEIVCILLTIVVQKVILLSFNSDSAVSLEHLESKHVIATSSVDQ